MSFYSDPKYQKLMRRVLIVLVFLVSNKTVIAINADNNDELIVAVFNRDINKTRALLRKGADPNIKYGKYGIDLIFLPVMRDNSDLVQLLVENGADIEAKLNGATPLNKAICIAGAYKTAIKLVRLGADVNANTNSCPNMLITAIGMAADQNINDLVKEMILHGADVNMKPDLNYPMTALDYAISRKSLSLVKILIEANADVNKGAGIPVRTPLQSALFIDDGLQIFKLLLQSGAAPNSSVEVKAGEILDTAFYRNKAALPSLLKAGADPNEGGAYYKSVQTGEIDLVRLFLRFGAKANIFISKKYITPLMLSARHGYTDIVQILIENNADSAVRNSDGDTAFDIAIKYGNVKTACAIKPDSENCLMNNY